jgi:hypothetical protein
MGSLNGLKGTIPAASYRTCGNLPGHSEDCTFSRYTDSAHDFPRASVVPMMMRKTFPIVLLVLLAFALVIQAPSMAAVPARVHHHAPVKTIHSKASQSKREAHKTAATSRVRQTPAGSAKLRSTRYSRPSMRPRSREAARAHARIRAAIARRRSHGRFAPLPRQLVHESLVMPPPLRGSHESLVHQNEMAEADGLERILDDADLADRIAHGSLVPVPTSSILRINTDLPENRRYCRPWTAKFLRDLAHAHAARFASSVIEVTSAVRTVEYQRRLRHTNGNAAAADGDVASPHLTGGTIDIAKQGMSAREIGWVRGWLIPLEQAGKIDVEEEFKQSCFHISVYKSYMAEKVAPASNPQTPLASGTMLAAHGR